MVVVSEMLTIYILLWLNYASKLDWVAYSAKIKCPGITFGEMPSPR